MLTYNDPSYLVEDIMNAIGRDRSLLLAYIKDSKLVEEEVYPVKLEGDKFYFSDFIGTNHMLGISFNLLGQVIA